MGLLDKLKDSVNLDKLKDSVNLDKLKDAAGGVLEMAKETISQVVEEGSKAIESSKATESTQQPSPLDEPNVLSYLNIIYRLVAKSSYTRPQVQRYVEKYVTVRLGETFDPEVFEKVLPYCPCRYNGEYGMAAWHGDETPDFGADTARIKELVEAVRHGDKDCLSYKELRELFLDDLQAALHAISDVDVEEFLSKIKDVHAEYKIWIGDGSIENQTALICRSVFEKAIAKDYNKILVVLRDRWNDGTDYVDIYREGFERLYRPYSYPLGNYYGTKAMLTEILHDLVKASYLADESAIQHAVGINFQLAMIYLWESKQLRDIDIAGIALRAVNFAQYGDNRETYPSLTEEKCREFILNNAYFQARLKKEHAFELEAYTESFIQSLFKHSVPGIGSLTGRTLPKLIVGCLMFHSGDEDYFIDSVCHRVARDFDHALVDANVTFKALLEEVQT